MLQWLALSPHSNRILGSNVYLCLSGFSAGTPASSRSPKSQSVHSVGHEIHPVVHTVTGFGTHWNSWSSQTMTDICSLLMLSSARIPEVTQGVPLPTHTTHKLVTCKSDNGLEGRNCDWERAVSEREHCGCKPLNPTLAPNGFNEGLKD